PRARRASWTGRDSARYQRTGSRGARTAPRGACPRDRGCHYDREAWSMKAYSPRFAFSSRPALPQLSLEFLRAALELLRAALLLLRASFLLRSDRAQAGGLGLDRGRLRSQEVALGGHRRGFDRERGDLLAHAIVLGLDALSFGDHSLDRLGGWIVRRHRSPSITTANSSASSA